MKWVNTSRVNKFGNPIGYYEEIITEEEVENIMEKSNISIPVKEDIKKVIGE